MELLLLRAAHVSCAPVAAAVWVGIRVAEVL
jgi:hypothetical protein